MQVTGAFQGKLSSGRKLKETNKTKAATKNSKQMKKTQKNPVRGVMNVEMFIGGEESVQPGKPPKAVSL